MAGVINKLLRQVWDFLTVNTLGSIISVSTELPIVALTFDDGPNPECTPKLLEILSKRDAQATFFMLGHFASKYPDLVRQVAEAGHAIGNHSWDHPKFSQISRKERRRQIRLCEGAIAPYGERLFRPPFGSENLGSRLDALLLGYEVVCWSVGAQDYVGHKADYMGPRVLKMLRPGSIIIFHDAIYPPIPEKDFEDRRPTLEAVDNLLAAVSGKYRFVTLPELLRLGQPQKQNWFWS